VLKLTKPVLLTVLPVHIRFSLISSQGSYFQINKPAGGCCVELRATFNICLSPSNECGPQQGEGADQDPGLYGGS
jgi:hypothetical protein